MASAAVAKKQAKTNKPRVLVVDDEPMVTQTIVDIIGSDVDCNMTIASSIAAARKVMASAEPFDLLVTDLSLPDGDGMSLVPELHEKAPAASAIVITGIATVDKAVSAIRGGASDFVTKPFTCAQLADRVRAALKRNSIAVRQEQKLDRLKSAVRKLNEARKLVSKKVDLLCNDLISAYGELSKQMDNVRTQEGFRKYVENAKDLEQLLCHSMDWLLRQIGYANVAVWLTGEDGEFQLGAYMKYTTAGDQELTDALKRVVLPLTGRDGFVKINAADLKKDLSPAEFRYLDGQEIIAINCSYLGESLASIVFFRNADASFKDVDAEIMTQIAPIFAVSLASVVHESVDENEDGQDDSEDAAPDLDSPPTKKPREKKNDADWWKRGEAPPF